MGTAGGKRPVVKFQKLAKDTRRSVRVFSISVLVFICIAKTEGVLREQGFLMYVWAPPREFA